ncbi:salivary acidic proline-rich phosphoprotein 1/2-like [Meriones unguiculatus]|uniref:salivary acidic proline-rich phosphoprotein 1/2-like n=1 Tax=Meriones unguiculatus TaxID=10047 RepID=UPI000B4F7D0F|nr:salivary acidic proline-rich phosphoprotein 1/2-like [Meriones unguiculatus]
MLVVLLTAVLLALSSAQSTTEDLQKGTQSLASDSSDVYGNEKKSKLMEPSVGEDKENSATAGNALDSQEQKHQVQLATEQSVSTPEKAPKGAPQRRLWQYSSVAEVQKTPQSPPSGKEHPSLTFKKLLNKIAQPFFTDEILYRFG